MMQKFSTRFLVIYSGILTGGFAWCKPQLGKSQSEQDLKGQTSGEQISNGQIRVGPA
jgi:hypothetical protein